MTSHETATTQAIRAVARGWMGRADARVIIQLLRECPEQDLDATVRELGARWLLRRMGRRWRGSRAALVQVLTVDRLHALSLQTRADLIAAMQRGRTGRLFEIAIRNTIVASQGDELRELRNRINVSQTHRDLSRLVFKDIDSEETRREILEHIAAHQGSTDEVKVLSDIDDTVFARLHDKRYPGKTRYPGVLAFFSALDHAPHGRGSDGDLTFVTARPSLMAGVVNWLTRRSLRRAGVDHVTILTGSLLALRSHEHMAHRKVANIRRYRQLFPEYGLVFVGDSGQGDVQVGRALLQEFPDAMRGVFIHDVNEAELARSSVHEDSDRIDFFDTYIAAAAAAWERGILSADQAREVSSAALHDLSVLTLLTPNVRAARLHELQRDKGALDSLVTNVTVVP